MILIEDNEALEPNKYYMTLANNISNPNKFMAVFKVDSISDNNRSYRQYACNVVFYWLHRRVHRKQYEFLEVWAFRDRYIVFELTDSEVYRHVLMETC